MKRVIALVIGLALSIFTTAVAQQNDADNPPIAERLKHYITHKGPEKTYIHSDKDTYVTGETIWYKIYMLDGVSHSISDKSKVVYLELLNERDSLIAKQKLFVDGLGAHGNLDIPQTISEGGYTLRAYTAYMLNEPEPLAFSKTITIWNLKNERDQTPKQAVREDTTNINIRFFPEGGNLVSGLQNTMGVKITDKTGKGLAFSGRIVDQAGAVSQQFETYEFGLGKFTYEPESGKRYFAILDGKTPKKYPLPSPMSKGYVLHVRNTKEHITIRVESNLTSGLQNTLLIGHIRGRIFLNHMESSNDNNFSVKINTTTLEDGVAHFTLFTATGEPVCERLSFIDNPNNDNLLDIRSVLPSYKKRERVDLTLDMASVGKIENFASFSVAVVNQTGLRPSQKESIKSWLLLNSDLGGTVPDAHFFFEKRNTKRKYLLDALMLTHGWRRFVWKELSDSTKSQTQRFEPEKGIVIKGRTTAFKNQYQLRPAFVSFNILGKNLFREKKATDNKGNFTFGPYIFQDTIKGMIQSEPMTVSEREAENQFKIFVEDGSPAIEVSDIAHKNQEAIVTDQPKKYVEQAAKKRQLDMELNAGTITLEGVTVEARKRTKRAEVEKRLKGLTRYQLPNQRIYTDSIFGTGALQPADLLLNIPGARAARDGLSIRGGGPPMYLLDGFQVERGDLAQINPNEIAVIDILKDGNAAGFGSGLFGNAGNGVIAIYTKSALGISSDQNRYFPNITNFTVQGFSKAREFYSPDYEVPTASHQKEDYRSTLFWEPNAIVDKKGFTNLKFYTGDVSGLYSIMVEGITAEGIPVREIKSFEVTDDSEK